MAGSTSGMNAVDILSVKSRVSWAAIAAGAMIALAVYFLLTLLGIAIGLEVAVHRNVDIGFGAAIYSILTLLIAMFFGGWATSRLAVGESKLEAILYGVILWGVLFVGMFWLIGVGVRIGFGAMMGLASGAVTVVDDSSDGTPSGDASDLIQRYNSELGGAKFVDDLTKLGVDPKQAEKIQGMVRDKVASVRTSQSTIPGQARAIAADPKVRQSAAQIYEATRRASWYTLAGVLISMLTVILGSLIGSGDLPVPVPLMGVRRPSSTPRS